MREYRVLFFSTCACAFTLLCCAWARAGIDNVIEAIRESQFRFAREGSQVPFVATGWAQARFYPETDFDAPDAAGTGGGGASFSEQVYNQGMMYPAIVRTRDMLLVGENITFDRVNVKANAGAGAGANAGAAGSSIAADQDVLTLAPIAAWLRQFGRKNLGAVFVAPMFARQTSRHGDWGTNTFAGALGMHWHSETLQWVYGAIYEYSFGKNYFYPYGGLIWAPAPKWSVAVIIPWPTVAYAPNDRWLLTIGGSPGGSAWRATEDGAQTTMSFYTWTLSAGAARRFYKQLWLYAGVGVSGLRSFDLSTGGGDAVIKTKPGAVFTVAVQLRP